MTNASSWENNLVETEIIEEEELVVEEWMFNFEVPVKQNDCDLAQKIK